MENKGPSYARIGLVVVGLLSITIGADVVADDRLSILLAVGGGLVVVIGGASAFRSVEQRGEYDERYLQIGLRGSTFSLWGFYWAVVVWSQVDSNAAVTTPVLEPLTWLLIVPWVAFSVTYLYYTRVM